MLKDYEIIILILSAIFSFYIIIINVIKIKSKVNYLEFLLTDIREKSITHLEYKLDIIHEDTNHLSERLEIEDEN